ncbi:predicted protein [Botrytis cinerea T4]|uniref:Uncharacterized protein n=1 Tax=Botryotinia fuckeliana (strain T4) TaxID=999810 RepID=G2Y3U3_BOTF4|nr:predicted protein [Botrytis cinerea T4]
MGFFIKHGAYRAFVGIYKPLTSFVPVSGNFIVAPTNISRLKIYTARNVEAKSQPPIDISVS